MAESKQAAPVLYRRVYVDLPVEADALLASKAQEMKVSKKALVEKLILDFTANQPKVKTSKRR